jgi:hypothetical protein
MKEQVKEWKERWDKRSEFEKRAWALLAPHMGAIQLEVHKLCGEVERLRKVIFTHPECCDTGGIKNSRCKACHLRGGDRCLVDGELIPGEKADE